VRGFGVRKKFGYMSVNTAGWGVAGEPVRIARSGVTPERDRGPPHNRLAACVVDLRVVVVHLRSGDAEPVAEREKTSLCSTSVTVGASSASAAP
jgi:hypothetical protein